MIIMEILHDKILGDMIVMEILHDKILGWFQSNLTPPARHYITLK